MDPDPLLTESPSLNKLSVGRYLFRCEVMGIAIVQEGVFEGASGCEGGVLKSVSLIEPSKFSHVASCNCRLEKESPDFESGLERRAVRGV